VVPRLAAKLSQCNAWRMHRSLPAWPHRTLDSSIKGYYRIALGQKVCDTYNNTILGMSESVQHPAAHRISQRTRRNSDEASHSTIHSGARFLSRVIPNGPICNSLCIHDSGDVCCSPFRTLPTLSIFTRTFHPGHRWWSRCRRDVAWTVCRCCSPFMIHTIDVCQRPACTWGSLRLLNDDMLTNLQHESRRRG
jgi:hypothetical protein